MKSEPDKLDFLIVLLPVVLIGLLGFQVYQYFQVDHDLVPNTPMNVASNPADDPGAVVPPVPSDGEASVGPAAEEALPADEPETGEGAASDAPPPDLVADTQPSDSATETGTMPTVEPQTIAAEDVPPPDTVAEIDAMPADEPKAMVQLEPGARAAAIAAQKQPTDTPELPPTVNPDADSAPEAAPLLSALEPGTVDTTGEEGLEESLSAEEVPGPMEVFLEFSPPDPVVNDVLAVEVKIRNADEVTAVIYHLRFNKSLLEVNGDPQAEPGPFLLDGDKTRFIANPAPGGKVVNAITLVRPDGGRSGDGHVATLYFKVLAAGEAKFSFLQATVRGVGNKVLPVTFLPGRLSLADLP